MTFGATAIVPPRKLPLVLLAVATTMGYWHWWAVPANADMTARGAQLADIRAETRRAAALANTGSDNQVDTERLERQLDALQHAFAGDVDTADLLRLIERAAADSGLRIRTVMPRPVVRRPFYAQWPLEVQLDGSFESLGDFLGLLNELRRPISITDLQIRPHPSPVPGMTIVAGCMITAFALTDTIALGVPQSDDSARSLVLAELDGEQRDSPEIGAPPAIERDPFVSPVRRTLPLAAAPLPVAGRPPGLAGLTTAEATLTGTLESANGQIAILEGPDKRTYIVRTGDRLFDGTVRTITPQAMLVETIAGGAAGLDRKQDVWKVLRQTHEAR